MNLSEIPFFNLKAQTDQLYPEILQAVSGVCMDASFSGGHFVETFEKEFSDFLGSPRFAGVSNGSDALMLALLALGIRPGDEVIVPANTYIATAFAPLRIRAIPVFADCDPLSWQIDPASAAEKINAKTKAIIGVHMYGQAFPLDEIGKLARSHGLFLLEDCAHSHGTRYNGKTVGTLSDAGCFSFYPSKNLGACGQAGGVALADPEADKRLRILREQGSEKKYIHDVLGYNMRLDSIQAAILSVKLRHLESWNRRRADILAQYRSNIHHPDLTFQQTFSHTEPAWYLAVVWAQDRDRLIASLREKHIACGIHYPVPCHLQKALAHLHYRPGDLPNAEAQAAHCVSLPLYPEMTDEEVDRVVEACNTFSSAK